MGLKKSQYSVEFIVIFAIAFLIFIVLIAVLNVKENLLDSKNRNLELRTLGEMISEKINLLYYLPNSTNYTIFVPEKVYNQNYSINLNISEKKLMIITEEYPINFYLITNKIQGDLEKNKTYTFLKDNGVIKIIEENE